MSTLLIMIRAVLYLFGKLIRGDTESSFRTMTIATGAKLHHLVIKYHRVLGNHRFLALLLSPSDL